MRGAAVLLGLGWGLGAWAAAPCPNPYFPLEEGLELQYLAGEEKVSVSFSETKQSGETAQARMSVALGASGRQGSAQVSCTAQGVSTDSGGLGVVALQSSGLDVKITDSEGILLPAPDTLRSGKPWMNKVSIEMTPPDTVKMPMGMKPIIRSTFRAESTFLGGEKVTTPAGTFEAIKIKNKTTAVAGSTGSERSMDSFLWFAPGVGLVKVMTGDHVDLELVGIRRPAQAKSEKPAKK
ncbi:MAG: DUF3108 domain-containing protein [Myxococcota bacterium]|nr:DUF3108 domain-containing protein [Myxococcota bacterium]